MRLRSQAIPIKRTSAVKRCACLASRLVCGSNAEIAHLFKTTCGTVDDTGRYMRKQPFRAGSPPTALAMLTLSMACFAQPATTVATTHRFEFHSDAWINLHHFLYQWAREDLGLVSGRPPISERSDVERMSSRDRDIWVNAVRFYRESIGTRWHLDSENLRLNGDLRNLGGDVAAQPPDRIKGIAAALGSAMPIYRRLWWPQHDRRNRAWIAKLVPLLRRHEARFVEMTIRVYSAKWPNSPFRVDVSAYFNYRAGYTSFEGYIVMYSTDPASQDLYALEMLFHEVQHAHQISDRVISQSALAPAFQAAGAKQPDNLWHALIFATAGEFVRSVATAEQLPEHAPYWVRQGFERQEAWSKLIPPLQKFWLPVMRGQSSTPEAIAALSHAFQ